jgi:uncharacterized integral membrane protein
MSTRTIGYALLALLLLALLVANWHLLVGATQLNLLLGQVTAPLIVLIVLVAGIVLAIEAFARARERRGWRAERYGLAQQLEQLRARADQTEGARIASLQALLERELAAIRVQLDRVLADASVARASLSDSRGPAG